MSQPQFLSRGIDYLGDLGAKLKDLQGFATLAHELIQNADDAPGVTSMCFDIRAEGLVVENDGTFSDCGKVEMEECPWRNEPNKQHRCDFHRFRHVAGGDKRDQPGTTGAFGIGFISVYQITDHPELISNGRHWILHEDRSEQERIEICPGCAVCSVSGQPKTRFILPWCNNPASKLRESLRAEATTTETPPKLMAEWEQSLPTAMLFLKSIKCIELKKDGKPHRKYERVDEGNSLILTDGDSQRDRVWHLIRGEFEAEAQRLRQHHPGRIEEKRTAMVALAIPQTELQTGVLCACLPSQHETGLPFHVNAEFFPTNDRKRIIFETDYQSAWNGAALKAAAAALAKAVGRLPELLGHQAIWNIFARLQQVAEEASKGRREKTLAEFWIALAPKLKDSPCIFTSQRQWKRPADAFILSQKEEVPAGRILEGLGVAIVHEDLRPHFNLLRSSTVNLHLFGLSNLAAALTESGLTGRTEKANWPVCLQSNGALETLWREVIILARREDRTDAEVRFGPNASKLLATAVIAPGRDGALWPCCCVFRAEDQTRELFQKIDPSIPFLGTFPEDYAPICAISPEFNVAAALERLRQLGEVGIKMAFDEKRFDLTTLFPWLEARKAEILAKPRLKEEITKLPIYPSSGALRPLVGLSLPGGFDDPLDLAALVELSALGGRREFLRDLGVNELSFQNYASNHLPQALSKDNLPVEKKYQAVLLLAGRLGEILDDKTTLSNFVEIPIVECQDGVFRRPVGIYFQNDIVIEVLGKGIPLANVPANHQAAIRKFYEWLGVADSPRFEDIVNRVNELVQQPPSVVTISTVKRVFAHLGERMRLEAPKETLSPLQQLAWLPARGQQDSWHRPQTLYAVFQDYLFESQARFLDLPREVQTSSTKLLEYLGVNITPTTAQVVDHLLHSASEGKPINQDVYRFLNNHTDDPSIRSLRDKPCLLLPDNTYVEPSQVFWGDHQFGRFRRQLGRELREFSKLFEMLGIREMPDHTDALKVLHEMSSAFGAVNKTLNDEAYAVLMRCWCMLEKARETGLLPENQLSALKAIKSIPNPNRVLNPPHWMFFEDRAGLAVKFDGFLKSNVISRPFGAWKAMASAGVQPLLSAVEIRLIECMHPVEETEVSARVRERKTELGRVLEAQAPHDTPVEKLDQLLCLRFESVEVLQIQYTLTALGRVLESKPESAPALFLREQQLLRYVPQGGHPPWSSVARELAIALFPDEEPGRIAPGLKEVLAASTEAEAKKVLDELGFAALETPPVTTVTPGDTVDGLGGAPPPPDQPLVDGPTTADTDPERRPTPTTEEAVAQLLGGDVPPPVPPPVGLDKPDRLSGQPRTGSGNGTGSGSGGSGVGTGAGGGLGGGKGCGAGGSGAGTDKGTASGAGEGPRGEADGRPFISYIATHPNEEDVDPDKLDHKARMALEEKAITLILQQEPALQRTPTHNPGFDLFELDNDGKPARWIEVKAMARELHDRPVGLSHAQFEFAQAHATAFWLYVVEHADDEANARIVRIRDPAGKARTFTFDRGWLDVAEVTDFSTTSGRKQQGV